MNGLGIAGAAVLLAVWLRHERRTSRRLLPSATFAADGRLRWLYVAMALLMISATPEFFVPYFAQALQDLGPLAAGYLATAMSAGWTAAAMLLSGVERRRRLIVHLAPIVSAVGLGLLVGVGPTHGGGAPVIVGIGIGLALVGWGIGTAWPHLATAVLGAVSAAIRTWRGRRSRPCSSRPPRRAPRPLVPWSTSLGSPIRVGWWVRTTPRGDCTSRRSPRRCWRSWRCGSMLGGRRPRCMARWLRRRRAELASIAHDRQPTSDVPSMLRATCTVTSASGRAQLTTVGLPKSTG